MTITESKKLTRQDKVDIFNRVKDMSNDVLIDFAKKRSSLNKTEFNTFICLKVEQELNFRELMGY